MLAASSPLEQMAGERSVRPERDAGAMKHTLVRMKQSSKRARPLCTELIGIMRSPDPLWETYVCVSIGMIRQIFEGRSGVAGAAAVGAAGGAKQAAAHGPGRGPEAGAGRSHALADFENGVLALASGRPISLVRVLGDVVSVEDKEPLRLTLDDGSGLLNCVLWSTDQVRTRL
ncbi:hypothetical protein T484DRAFT_1897463 [Baffinella frigidus]|nr:hypothetical protein T484DRAFT_1897463 [Cryptophyta sp. CCMP2293]